MQKNPSPDCCHELSRWAHDYGNNAERSQRQRIREANPHRLYQTIYRLQILLTVEAASTLLSYSTRYAQLKGVQTPDELYYQIIEYLDREEGLLRARNISEQLTEVMQRNHGYHVPLPAFEIVHCALKMLNTLFQESTTEN